MPSELLHVFINEWSFCEQFHDTVTLRRAMAIFLALVDEARKALRGGRGVLYRSRRLSMARAVRDVPSAAAINQLIGETREAFVDVVFNRANPVEWEQGALSSGEDIFTWRAHDVTGTSMAELAERRYGDASIAGCLLNLGGSPMATLVILSILRNALEPAIDLPCADEREALRRWLENFRGARAYSATDSEPPIDEQTCLVDSTRFERTTRTQQGRHVFRELTTGDFWYVDNLHGGPSAHLEVFDKRRNHKGEASLEGHIRLGTRVKGRTLD